MLRTLKALWNDENGFIASGEFVLVMTVGVLALVVGLSSMSKSVSRDFGDVGGAMKADEQRERFSGLKNAGRSRAERGTVRDREDDRNHRPSDRTPREAGSEAGRK